MAHQVPAEGDEPSAMAVPTSHGRASSSHHHHGPKAPPYSFNCTTHNSKLVCGARVAVSSKGVIFTGTGQFLGSLCAWRIKKRGNASDEKPDGDEGNSSTMGAGATAGNVRKDELEFIGTVGTVSGGVQSVSVSTNGELVCAVSGLNTILVWNVDDEQLTALQNATIEAATTAQDDPDLNEDLTDEASRPDSTQLKPILEIPSAHDVVEFTNAIFLPGPDPFAPPTTIAAVGQAPDNGVQFISLEAVDVAAPHMSSRIAAYNNIDLHVRSPMKPDRSYEFGLIKMWDFTCISAARHDPPTVQPQQQDMMGVVHPSLVSSKIFRLKPLPPGVWVGVADMSGNIFVMFLPDEQLASYHMHHACAGLTAHDILCQGGWNVCEHQIHDLTFRPPTLTPSNFSQALLYLTVAAMNGTVIHVPIDYHVDGKLRIGECTRDDMRNMKKCSAPGVCKDGQGSSTVRLVEGLLRGEVRALSYFPTTLGHDGSDHHSPILVCGVNSHHSEESSAWSRFDPSALYRDAPTDFCPRRPDADGNMVTDPEDDATAVATGGKGRSGHAEVKLIYGADSEVRYTIGTHKEPVMDVCVAPKGDFLVSLGLDGNLSVFKRHHSHTHHHHHHHRHHHHHQQDNGDESYHHHKRIKPPPG